MAEPVEGTCLRKSTPDGLRGGKTTRFRTRTVLNWPPSDGWHADLKCSNFLVCFSFNFLSRHLSWCSNDIKHRFAGEVHCLLLHWTSRYRVVGQKLCCLCLLLCHCGGIVRAEIVPCAIHLLAVLSIMSSSRHDPGSQGFAFAQQDADECVLHNIAVR